MAIAVSHARGQTRVPRIGILSGLPLKSSGYGPPLVRALANLGYRDGAGAIIDYRSADGFTDRYPKLARELVEAKCDVIFVFASEESTLRTVLDLRAAVPTAFLAEFDPVEKGLVASFARPGGNATGVWVSQRVLLAKRVQILHEIVPAVNRFLILSDGWNREHLPGVRKAAAALNLQLTVVDFQARPYDFQAAFATGRKNGVGGVVLLNSPVFREEISQISKLAVENRLPSVGTAYAGILVAYYGSLESYGRKLAAVGARILKGAKPADIPVEQVDEFELAINRQVARALGVKIPESVMARATKVIE